LKAVPDTDEERIFVENLLASVKRMQYLIDQTSRVRHMLDLNSTVLKNLKRTSERLREERSQLVAKIGRSFDEKSHVIWEECQIHLKTVSSLSIRATNTSQHVGSSI